MWCFFGCGCGGVFAAFFAVFADFPSTPSFLLLVAHQQTPPTKMSGNTPSLPCVGFNRTAALYRAHSTAAGAVRAVSKTVKTSFVEAGGKQKAATPITTNRTQTDPTPARKRRVVSVTPVLSITSAISGPALSTPCPPRTVDSSCDRRLFNSSTSGAMIINQWGDVVPPHAQHRPLVLQCMYKRLSPIDIVRLSPQLADFKLSQREKQSLFRAPWQGGL